MLRCHTGRTRGAHKLLAQRGSLMLLWGLTCSTTVLVLIVGYFPLFQNTVASTNRAFALEQAAGFAEAGLEHALWEIRTNQGARLRENPQAANNPWAVLASNACDDEIDGGADGLLYGMPVTSCQRFPRATATHQVTAGDNFGGKIGDYTVWVMNYPGRTVRIISRGLSASAVNPAAETTMAVRTLQTDLQTNSHGFYYATFGDKYLYAEGRVQLDSYNSQLGGGFCDYNTNCASQTNRFENGDVGTNGMTNAVAQNWGYIRMGDDSALADYDGKAYLTPWSQAVYDSPGGCLDCVPTSTNTQRKATMPSIQIPAEVSTYANYGDKVYVGNPLTNPEMYCNEPRRYNTLQVHGGEFHIGPNCKIYIERPSGSSVATGNAMNTDGDGKFRLLSGRTTPFKLFIKDGGFNLDGPGFVNDMKKPDMLQMYVTGMDTVGSFAQTQPFHGIVYVEDPDGNATDAGAIIMYPGNQGGVVSDLQMYGSFIAGGKLWLHDQSWQNPFFWVRVHHDENTRQIPLDGTDDGTPATRTLRYVIQNSAWVIR